MVWQPNPYQPDEDPVAQMHLALVNDPRVTPKQLADHFRLCLDLLIGKRKQAAPAIAKRLAVEPVLADPAHADDPRRPAWERQYADLVDAENGVVGAVLWEVYHLARLWDALSVKDRVTYELHTAVGLDARTEDLGRALAFIDRGPVQRAAPLPSPYAYPDSLKYTLPVDVALMIDECPF